MYTLYAGIRLSFVPASSLAQLESERCHIPTPPREDVQRQPVQADTLRQHVNFMLCLTTICTDAERQAKEGVAG